jgi:hypothetical protein
VCSLLLMSIYNFIHSHSRSTRSLRSPVELRDQARFFYAKTTFRSVLLSARSLTGACHRPGMRSLVETAQAQALPAQATRILAPLGRYAPPWSFEIRHDFSTQKPPSGQCCCQHAPSRERATGPVCVAWT